MRLVKKILDFYLILSFADVPALIFPYRPSEPTARANGTVSINRLTGESFVLTGTGIEDPDRDGNPLTVSITVYADAMSAPIITYCASAKT